MTFNVTVEQAEELVEMMAPKNVRIFINDIQVACLALGEVKVVAAGAMYATLECNELQRIVLTNWGVCWTLD